MYLIYILYNKNGDEKRVENERFLYNKSKISKLFISFDNVCDHFIDWDWIKIN